MARLSTQPAATATTSTATTPRKPIQLRSNFIAIPITLSTPTSSSDQYIHSRPHHSDLPSSEEEEHKLFITGLPVGLTEKSLKMTFKSLGSISSISFLPPTNSLSTLLSRELSTALHSPSSSITPLFSPLTTSSLLPPSTSIIITFQSSPLFPPPQPLSIKLKPTSFLSLSKDRHATSLPNLSTIISHSDTWMSAFDLRKLASIPASYVPSLPTTKSKSKSKASPALIPGSASHALSLHAANQALTSNPSYNPDLEPEEEWTLVTRGGKHGKSLLPTDARPNVGGYGGVNVKVAKKVRYGEEEEKKKKESGVEDGFYRFTREEKKREELLDLKRRFEEDRNRISRGGSSRGRGGGRGGSSARGGGGRDKRAYKPY